MYLDEYSGHQLVVYYTLKSELSFYCMPPEVQIFTDIFKEIEKI